MGVGCWSVGEKVGRVGEGRRIRKNMGYRCQVAKGIEGI